MLVSETLCVGVAFWGVSAFTTASLRGISLGSTPIGFGVARLPTPIDRDLAALETCGWTAPPSKGVSAWDAALSSTPTDRPVPIPSGDLVALAALSPDAIEETCGWTAA